MKILPILLSMLALAVATPVKADELGDYLSTLQTLFQKQYPEVTSTPKDGGLVLDYKTRIFLVHERTKIGEWQDAVEERGPNRGGIFCEIVPQEGPYDGQAAVPQVFDKRYFKVLLLAPYSKRLNRHLHILLSYPDGTPDAFLKQFKEAVGRFEML